MGVDLGVVCVLLFPVMLALRNDCPASEGLPEDTLGVTNIWVNNIYRVGRGSGGASWRGAGDLRILTTLHTWFGGKKEKNNNLSSLVK